MEFSRYHHHNLRALKMESPEFTGISDTKRVVLEMGTLPRHERYDDDVVFVKLKEVTALNEIAVAEWAAALGWENVAPALVDSELVFEGTPPSNALCTRWLKGVEPLDNKKPAEMTSDAWRRNRIFELLIRKGDDHQWNTVSSEEGAYWWSIDHDEVELASTPNNEKRAGKERHSRMGNDNTDRAVRSEFGQRILREALTRDLPPVLKARVEALIG